MRPRQIRLAESLLEGEGFEDAPAIRLKLLFQTGRGNDFVEEGIEVAYACVAQRKHAMAVEIYSQIDRIMEGDGGSKPETMGRIDPVFELTPLPEYRKPTGWFQFERSLLAVKEAYFKALRTVGGGGSEMVMSLITQVNMIATRLRDSRYKARAILWHGNLHNQRGEDIQARERYQEALNLLENSNQPDRRDLVDAYLGLGIALRMVDEKKQSEAILKKTSELAPDDPIIQIRYHANIGALYFYDDIQQRRHHWQTAHDLAAQAGEEELQIHMAVDLASIDILEDRLEEAWQQLGLAAEQAEKLGLDNSMTRIRVLFSTMALLEEQPKEALIHLAEAERLGYAYQAGRRLWKIHANAATAHEMMEKMEPCYDQDRKVLAVLTKIIGERRIGISTANIILRSRKDSRFSHLVDQLSLEARQLGEKLVRAVETEMSGGIFPREHFKRIGRLDRFVMT